MAASTAIAAGGTTLLTAAATDSDGTIAKVEFYDGTTLLSTDTTAPYSYVFSSAVVGGHALTAIAYDNASATTTSNGVNVVVGGGGGGNISPTITLTSAATSIASGGTAALTAAAADPDGTVSRVDFYDGPTLLSSDTTAPYTYNFTSTVAGAHPLRAIVYDNLSAATTSNIVNVTVRGGGGGNQSPTVSLSASSTAITAGGTTTPDGHGVRPRRHDLEGRVLRRHDAGEQRHDGPVRVQLQLDGRRHPRPHGARLRQPQRDHDLQRRQRRGVTRSPARTCRGSRWRRRTRWCRRTARSR